MVAASVKKDPEAPGRIRRESTARKAIELLINELRVISKFPGAAWRSSEAAREREEL